MGIFSSIKKLFFAAESVAKSGAEKTSDLVHEKALDLKKSSEDIRNEIKESVNEKTAGLREAISDTGDEIVNSGATFSASIKNKATKIKDKAGDFLDEAAESDIVKDAANLSETIGEKLLDAGENFMEGLENLGNEIAEKGKEASEKLSETSKKIGNEISEKGKEASEKINTKIDEIVEKAEKEKMEESLKPQGKFSDRDLDSGDSLLDGTDDFFAKASQYSEGNYDAFSEGKIAISEEKTNLPRKEPAKAAGFIDRDHDGNELIDDAIISEEE